MTQIERKQERLLEALATRSALRHARGPWATTNRKANQKLVNRLDRELKELQDAAFRAKFPEG
jgi:hypothetical protein